jgi:hypothetical protein
MATRCLRRLGLALAIGASSAQVALAAPVSDDGLVKPSSLPPATVADWLTRHTSIKLQTVVSVGDEYIVAVLSSRATNPARPKVLDLEIRAEMTDPTQESSKMLRSLSATLQVNCADHTSHFLEVRTFAGPNLTGAEQVSHPVEDWVPNPPGSYFEDIDAAVCTPNPPRPLLAAKPSASRAPAAETATPPKPLALRPALTADAAPRTPPRPAPAKPKASDRAGGEAQIAAGASEAKAAEALAALKSAQPALMRGLGTRIEPIQRDGVAYYRALVFGFVPPSGAAGFCRQMTALGRACLVR